MENFISGIADGNPKSLDAAIAGMVTGCYPVSEREKDIARRLLEQLEHLPSGEEPLPAQLVGDFLRGVAAGSTARMNDAIAILSDGDYRYFGWEDARQLLDMLRAFSTRSAASTSGNAGAGDD